MKKLFIFFVIIISQFSTAIAQENSPTLNCVGLPGCVDSDISNPTKADLDKNIGLDLISGLISEVIQITAVIAIISLMLSGLMYILSFGDEEKTKRAKNWIIWSLVGVVLTISAYGIINVINSLNIN